MCTNLHPFLELNLLLSIEWVLPPDPRDHLKFWCFGLCSTCGIPSKAKNWQAQKIVVKEWGGNRARSCWSTLLCLCQCWDHVCLVKRNRVLGYFFIVTNSVAFHFISAYMLFYFHVCGTGVLGVNKRRRGRSSPRLDIILEAKYDHQLCGWFHKVWLPACLKSGSSICCNMSIVLSFGWWQWTTCGTFLP